MGTERDGGGGELAGVVHPPVFPAWLLLWFRSSGAQDREGRGESGHGGSNKTVEILLTQLGENLI